MSWTPHYTGEPHALAGVLSGALPFTPHDPNYGALNPTGAPVEGVALAFGPVLTPLPEADACYEESLRFVWAAGTNLTASQVTAPEGWSVVDVTATSNWPGTTVLLVSPPSFRGLSVTVNFGGATVWRVVAQTEWRGEPADLIVELGDGPGGAS